MQEGPSSTLTSSPAHSGVQGQEGVFPGVLMPSEHCCPHLGYARGDWDLTKAIGVARGSGTCPGHSWMFSRSRGRSCWRSVLGSRRSPTSRLA